MSKLETRIAEWRARMLQALPQRDEAVAELEEHLREHFAHLQRQGKPDEEAFALAQEKVGKPHAIAREFERMPAGWRPGLIMLPILALILAFGLGHYLWLSQRIPVRALHAASTTTATAACFAMLGSALIATTAFLKTSWRPLRERERLAVRRILAKLARLALLFLPIAWALGTWWRTRVNPGHPSIQWDYHLQLAGTLVSVALLIFAQSRAAPSDRVRWFMAIIPLLIMLSASFGRLLRVANIPLAWVCVVFILVQVILVLPRFRIRIERVRELN